LIRIFKAEEKAEDLAKRLRKNIIKDEEELKRIKEIIEDVKKRGDEALLDYSYKFDGVKLKNIKVSKDEIDKAYSFVSDNQMEALKLSIKNVESLAKFELESIKREIILNDSLIKLDYRPLKSVGCYIPFGKASYPSSIIMSCIPAKVAGVERIVITSPLKEDIQLNALLLVTADLCGVKEFYRIGGAQAIAALAYGTESIKPTDKIIGPGGKFVTLAKYLISRDKPIDFLAGPTELIIIADKKAKAEFIAWDLIAQAEHDVDVICGLITDSEDLARRVKDEILKVIENIDRKDIVKRSLANNGFIIVCKDLNYAIDFVNHFAPEHLQIVTEERLEDKINSAGLIALGDYTPIALCDYSLGTNHILPTLGYSRFYSGLSVLDFVKRIKIVKANKNTIYKLIDSIKELALAEGLTNHYVSVRKRVYD